MRSTDAVMEPSMHQQEEIPQLQVELKCERQKARRFWTMDCQCGEENEMPRQQLEKEDMNSPQRELQVTSLFQLWTFLRSPHHLFVLQERQSAKEKPHLLRFSQERIFK